jgi:putative flippase GtrA
MKSKWSTAAPGAQHPLQHMLGFVFSGGLAFIVDAGVLELLVAGLGVDKLTARVISLSFAHVAGWLSHRRFTFRLTTPPTWRELVRYAGVQYTVALLNYGIYALIVLLNPDIRPLYALIVSSGVAMFFSYFGIRFGAFRLGRRPQE